jgi:acyl-CoA dehydrogenase
VNDLASFRADVRHFIADELPPALAERAKRGFLSTRDETLRWQQILYRKGWGAPQWPKEFGGPGWSPLHQLAFEEECCLAGAPERNIQGISTLAPVIQAFGTTEQHARFLTPIIKGEAYWCQGFSEPNAGSDLASLRTRAERRGDRYIINGQKIWTSHAHWADWIFMLVRTGEGSRKQEGLSLLLVDMKTPGISVRPLISIDGCHHLNETFYEEVVVPVDQRIGEENQGWKVAKYLLGAERVMGSADLPGLKRQLARIKRLSSQQTGTQKPLMDEPLFLARLAQLEIQVLAIESMILTMLATGERSSTAGWVSGSVLKARAAELHQHLSELALECLGSDAAIDYPDALMGGSSRVVGTPPRSDESAGIAVDYFFRRAKTIAGGSSEIQRNIISRTILGL